MNPYITNADRVVLATLRREYQTIAYSRYNTVMRTFKSRDAAERYADRLNRTERQGMVYGVREVESCR